jgi:hypothetical protein
VGESDGEMAQFSRCVALSNCSLAKRGAKAIYIP